ncbi:MAG: PDZ domain-containing protein [Chloroflexi bacterium]|nr:PDZ domain-containing protein [Chloroflexota bacterium]
MKEFLSRKGVKYTEKDVNKDEAAAEEMIAKSNQMGVPVIIIDGQVIVGFNRPVLENLLSKPGGKVHFGLGIADSSVVAQKLGQELLPGVFVGKVVKGSPAEKADLKEYDVIIEFNTQPVKNSADLEKLIQELKPGSKVNLTYVRNKETLRSETVV